MSKSKSKVKCNEELEFRPVSYRYRGFPSIIEWDSFKQQYKVSQEDYHFHAYADTIPEVEKIFEKFADAARLDNFDVSIKKLEKDLKYEIEVRQGISSMCTTRLSMLEKQYEQLLLDKHNNLQMSYADTMRGRSDKKATKRRSILAWFGGSLGGKHE